MREPQIKEILSTGETEKAIEATKELVQNNPSFSNELVLLAARLETIENEKRQGIIDDTNFRTEKNKINAGVLHILDNHHLPVTPTPNPSVPKNNLKNYLLVGMASLLLGFLGFYFLYNKDSSPITTADLNHKDSSALVLQISNDPPSKQGSEKDASPEPITFNTSDAEEKLELFFDSKMINRKDHFVIDANQTVSYLKGSLINYYHLKQLVIQNTPDHFDKLHWSIMRELQTIDNEQQTLKEAGFRNGDRVTMEFFMETYPQPAKTEIELINN